MDNDFALGRNVIGDQHRNADAEIDVPAFRNVARGAAPRFDRASTACSSPFRSGSSRIGLHVGFSFTSPSARRKARAPRDARRYRASRSFSGSSAPRSTMCCACAMVNFGGHRHHRIEIARRRFVGEIAPAIRLPGFDQRDVAGQRFFQHVVAAARIRAAPCPRRAASRPTSACRKPGCRRRRRACARPSCPAASLQARSCRRGKALSNTTGSVVRG